MEDDKSDDEVCIKATKTVQEFEELIKKEVENVEKSIKLRKLRLKKEIKRDLHKTNKTSNYNYCHRHSFLLVFLFLIVPTCMCSYYCQYNIFNNVEEYLHVIFNNVKECKNVVDNIIKRINLNSNELANDPKDKLNDVIQDLKSIKLKYKNQEINLWENVFASIKMTIVNPTKPTIILLLSNKLHTMDCLVDELANVCSKALNTNSLKLTPENFDNNTGLVITSMVSRVVNKKIVIIWDLLKINVEAFKAFHNLCDTINPLIKEVMYIITVIADNYDNKSNPLEFIEKEIWKKLTGKIKEDSISPLITRITDGAILTVNSEPNNIECPSKEKKYKSSWF